MKKLIIFAMAVVAFMACQNQERVFDDFDIQTVYFPIQYPARTLALGESRTDNTIDLEHAFSIGVSVGGMYNNIKERVVDISLDPSLVDGATIGGRPLRILPESYYESMSFDQITIPQGEFSGTLRVNLTDAFFEDTLTTDVNYVVPLVIEKSTADSVLRGIPLPEIGDDADRRVATDWKAGYEPKDFTLFAIKYINRYHGTFLHSGVDYTLDTNGDPIDTLEYKAKYVEQDLQTLLTTKSLTTCFLDRLGGANQGDAYKVELEFDDANGTIQITSAHGDPNVTGTGTFIEATDPNAVVWGGRGHMTLYLEYEYVVGGETHRASDMLVYRDNNMMYEEFTIELVLN